MGEADDATIIVSTIIGLAHNLGLSVTAEGVETPEQLALVREFMCEEAQGFLYSKPISSTEFGAYLSTARMAGSGPIPKPRSRGRTGGRL